MLRLRYSDSGCRSATIALTAANSQPSEDLD